MIEGGTDVTANCANACGNGAISAAVTADIWCQGDSYDQSSLPGEHPDPPSTTWTWCWTSPWAAVADGSFRGRRYNLGLGRRRWEVLISDNVPQEVADEGSATIDHCARELVITAHRR